MCSSALEIWSEDGWGGFESDVNENINQKFIVN